MDLVLTCCLTFLPSGSPRRCARSLTLPQQVVESCPACSQSSKPRFESAAARKRFNTWWRAESCQLFAMGAAFSWTSRTWIDGSRPTRSRHVIDNRRGDSINLRHAEKTSIRVDLPPREPLLDQVLQKRRTCVRIERELQIRRCAALARATSRGNLQRNAPGQPGKTGHRGGSVGWRGARLQNQRQRPRLGRTSPTETPAAVFRFAARCNAEVRERSTVHRAAAGLWRG